MKKIVLALAIVSSLIACKSSDKKGPGEVQLTKELKEKAAADTANYTTIEWMDPSPLNLGKLVKGQSVEVTFRFRNSGTKNLIIEDVAATCGCTIPEKPAKPFAPGEEGIIKAKFDGSGAGTISKRITVIANTNPQKEHYLTFTGELTEVKN